MTSALSILLHDKKEAGHLQSDDISTEDASAILKSFLNWILHIL